MSSHSTLSAGKMRRRRVAWSVVIAIAVPVLAASRQTPQAAAAIANVQHDGTRIASSQFGYSVVIPRGWTYQMDVGPGNVTPVLFSAQSQVENLSLADCTWWPGQSLVVVAVSELPYQATTHERRAFRARRRRAWCDFAVPRGHLDHDQLH